MKLRILRDPAKPSIGRPIAEGRNHHDYWLQVQAAEVIDADNRYSEQS